jgi:hypothetical protein
LCAQSQPVVADSGRESKDVNSVGPGSAMTQGLSTPDSAAVLTVEQLQTQKKQIAESQKLSEDRRSASTENAGR